MLPYPQLNSKDINLSTDLAIQQEGFGSVMLSTSTADLSELAAEIPYSSYTPQHSILKPAGLTHSRSLH